MAIITCVTVRNMTIDVGIIVGHAAKNNNGNAMANSMSNGIETFFVVVES